MLPNNFFDCIAYPSVWFFSLIEGVGLTNFVMGAVIAALVSRFLLLPFFSGSLSDGVKEPTSNNKRTNKSDLKKIFKE